MGQSYDPFPNPTIGVTSREIWYKYNFTYLIVVCDRAEQECPLFPFSTYRLYWPFEDPSAAQGPDEIRLERFRAVRDQIAAKIRGWLRELEQQNILPRTTSTH